MTQPPPPPPSQQPVAQPGWQQPGSQQGWQQPGPSSPSPRTRTNGFGIAALALAILLVLVGPAQQLAFTLSIGQGDGSSFGAISTAFAVARFGLTFAVLVLGVLGLVVRDRGRLLAAAAVGIGAFSAAATALSFVVGLALS